MAHSLYDNPPGHHAPQPELVETIKHPPARVYWITYGLLVVLLFVTVGLYSIDLSHMLGWVGWNIIVAMVVAVTKAILVILYFMNVRGGTRLTWLWAALGFVWFLLLFGIFLDYQFRNRIEVPGWQ